ncbi:dihydropteroate synthase [Occallatibacter riparius]|uniref:Dihydropteroate synthase n=1 Tax=Occallatibacter riparius TaxID=1002689 RepID=A0A9J7BV22_9BACT|nr:dihydropteroate synthase [Occallatibacter riparius]UWZ85618.1 dihydropteroate synthase [Occallatibacter riparius]
MYVRRTVSEWHLRTRSLEVGARTLVMGVVNITPDSFSDGGVSFSHADAVGRALQLMDEGADLLDLGAESTRPGSRAGGADAAVSAEEEQARLLPVIEGIRRARPDAVLSVDTYKAATASEALAAGAEIINDVSGFTWDADMPRVCAETGAGVILMHTRGKPDQWRGQERLGGHAVLRLVRDGLSESLSVAERAGIRRNAIVLDPGYGFGKRFGENYSLLARQAELLSLGCPLLAGVSRKSFLGHTLAPLHDGEPAPVNQRENASLAAMVAAILQGASIVRVHSVRAAAEAARIADAALYAF